VPRDGRLRGPRWYRRTARFSPFGQCVAAGHGLLRHGACVSATRIDAGKAGCGLFLPTRTRPNFFLFGRESAPHSLGTRQDGIDTTVRITDNMAELPSYARPRPTSSSSGRSHHLRRMGIPPTRLPPTGWPVCARSQHAVQCGERRCPRSTLNPTGDHIPIEERSAKEVTHIKAHKLAPEGRASEPGLHVRASLHCGPHPNRARDFSRAPITESLKKAHSNSNPLSTRRTLKALKVQSVFSRTRFLLRASW